MLERLGAFLRKSQQNDRHEAWIQPVDATHGLNLSAGVLVPSAMLMKEVDLKYRMKALAVAQKGTGGKVSGCLPSLGKKTIIASHSVN